MNPVHGDKYLLARQRWAQLRGNRKEFRSTSRFRHAKLLFRPQGRGGSGRGTQQNRGKRFGLPTPIKLAGCP